MTRPNISREANKGAFDQSHFGEPYAPSGSQPRDVGCRRMKLFSEPDESAGAPAGHWVRMFRHLCFWATAARGRCCRRSRNCAGGISRHNGRLQRLPHTGIFFWKTGQLTLSRRVGCRLRNPRRGCFRRSQHHARQGDRHRQLDQGADRDCHSDRAAPRRPHAGADHAVARICATHKRRRRCNCSIPSKPEAGKPSGAGPVQARGKGIDLYVQDLAAGPNCGRSAKIAVALVRLGLTVTGVRDPVQLRKSSSETTSEVLRCQCAVPAPRRRQNDRRRRRVIA